MATPVSHIYYRTTTNLIHPAVLGTIIVNFIELIFSGGITSNGLLPIIASAGLIWYFVLDFWVTTIAFEHNPASYTFPLFLLDIAVLIILFASFYFLWKSPDDQAFFATLALQVLAILTWNHVSRLAPCALNNRYTQALLALAVCCCVPVITANAVSVLTSSAINYVVLGCLFVFLVQYSREIFSEQ